MKLVNIFLILFLFTLASHVSCDDKKIPPWCWTKPAKADFSVAPENGGSNWAYCELPEAGGDGSVKIPYRLYIITPNVKGAGAVG